MNDDIGQGDVGVPRHFSGAVPRIASAGTEGWPKYLSQSTRCSES